MANVEITQLQQLNSLDKLGELFTEKLNYEYSTAPISTRTWKPELRETIKDNEIKLLARHQEFQVIYCKLDRLLLGYERPLINQLLKDHIYSLFVFSDAEERNWHLVNVKYDEEIKNRRIFRRIVIGPDERLHTAAERINLLEVTDDRIPALALQVKHDEAFDVEKVTKEFYEQYTELFELLSKNIAEENPQLDSRTESQIILDRLLFLYFIQKKGWLNNNTRYLYDNFLKYWTKDPKGESYYTDFLVQLFQAVSSEKAIYQDRLGSVPFLNGGLFEVDPFHSKLPFQLRIRNETFNRIYTDLLEHFNFTVREDTPLDVEVAIDPEMLGKIFENLILKLEKGEDLRKKTGSYYTPRVIVHFMCKESLKEYLVTESELDMAKIESLFSMNPADQLTAEELQELNKIITPNESRLLKNLVKKAYILDPAVGSGAFLVGMLHEMIYLLKLLDIREFGQDRIFKPNYDYELKRHLIESALNGVDIQEEAVRICELRLWLSLIVDYDRQPGQEIPPLPNLSYKIRCGDSLIEKLFGYNVQLDQLVKTDKGRQLIDEIKQDKSAYFLARDIQDKRKIELKTLSKQCELMELLIKEKIRTIQGAQLSLLEETAEDRRNREEHERTIKEYETIFHLARTMKDKVRALLQGKQVVLAADINDLKKKLGISFIWKLDFAEVFNEKGGFDIAVANPPYVRQEGIKQFKPQLQKAGFEVYNSTSDLYTYFYEKSWQILKPSGFSCFISSNKWMRAKYGEKLRRFFKDKTNLLQIIDFGGYKVFDATVDTNILLFQKGNTNQGNNISVTHIKNDFSKDLEIPTYISTHSLLFEQKRLDLN
ncbi:MAG: Eco57I restriction-modification methylase domain-containing protein, partial [bacterium]|nr:Eco57I restriction-modification methylase domain-containing protein [bacterium]